MKQYVIIGNGTAAIGCIEGIRSRDRDSDIIVVSQENRPAYCRPLISYYLEGKAHTERMSIRPDSFYEDMGCEVLYGVSAVKLDSNAKGVVLSDGIVIPYDELCVAVGSSPFVPPLAGLDTVKDKYTFLTLDDALSLEQAVNPDSRVLIVGAGLIGLKCAEGLHGRVKSITVCDLADRVLSSILDSECAGIMQERLEKNGIRFLLGDSADSFEGNTAKMKSGKTVEFDVLVLAVGVRANTELVKTAGGEVNRGIIVDSAMKTTLPHVCAAGDCAEGVEMTTGEHRVIAILPNAYMQGYTAGVNMAGGDAIFDNAVAMNSIGFFDLHCMTAGTYDGEMTEERTETGIKRFYVKNGLLTGFIIIGDTDRAGIYTSLIRNKTPLDTLDFDALKKSAGLMPFSRSDRGKMLGGVV